MSRYAAIGLVVLLIAGAWTATTTAFPEPATTRKPEGEPTGKEDDAQVKLDAIKKQLPSIASRGCESGLIREPKVRLARRTSPTEAKITLVAKTPTVSAEPGEPEHPGADCFFVIYLRYFDGAWTTIRWEADYCDSGSQKTPFRPYIQKLTLAIDEIDGK